MGLIDYTGKLNHHEEYLKIINLLEEDCYYVEVVLIDEKETNDLINLFKKDIISCQKVSEWWGTKLATSLPVNYLYRLKATPQLFHYLRKFETFCKYYDCTKYSENLERGDYSEITDFGYDDIAFYDQNNQYLLYTTTHEGYITIDSKLIS